MLVPPIFALFISGKGVELTMQSQKLWLAFSFFLTTSKRASSLGKEQNFNAQICYSSHRFQRMKSLIKMTNNHNFKFLHI
mmetsp:Transcript_58762/g.128660  ORF Transcript_58762/g.128660 Transcript_58762/m.128660 type:complete len:80 (-) Transcript_58762:841-1080(-)